MSSSEADMEVYDVVLVGRGSATTVTSAFVGIEQQSAWNGEVIGGEWILGTPGTAMAERRLRLTRGMWQN